MSIIVFGSINMDLTTYVPVLPRPGETLFGHSFITVPGGKGSNQAIACAHLGAKTKFIGRVGDDAFGHAVLDLVKADGVDLSGVVVDPDHGTGLAVISVDDSAENSIIVISGANMAFDQSDVDRCVAAMEGAKVLLLQHETPLETSLAAARTAREKGLAVLWDPAPARELPDEAFELATIMTPNETETEALVGFRPHDQETAKQAASLLRDKGVETAVIKLGAEGVYYENASESGFVSPFEVDAIDTVAAGDAFNGGLAVALAEGRSLGDAVRWGAASGALATTKKGASTAMPYRTEFDQLLKEGKQK